MGDNLYFIESIYTPADSINSVVTLFPTKEEEQAVIVRNLEEGQLKMHNHRGTIREGWYVYVDEDMIAVNNIFTLLYKFCKRHGDGIQIIVTDHADDLTIEGVDNFQDIVRARWRKKNEGLIRLA